MWLLRYAVLILFAFSVNARQVHYYFNGASGVGYHSGNSTAELRASWASCGMHEGASAPACPFYPQPGHRGSITFAPSSGCWAMWIWVGNQIFSGQGGNDGTFITMEWGYLQGCSACGNGGYYNHTIRTLSDSAPASANWLWDGTKDTQKYIKDVTFTHDLATGAITGYSGTFIKPFGGFLDNTELGIVGNGSFGVGANGAPTWIWKDGVAPPVNPETFDNMASGLDGVRLGIVDMKSAVDLVGDKITLADNNIVLATSKIEAVKTELQTLNASQKDYTANFNGLESAISGLTLSTGDISVSVDNSGVIGAVNEVRDAINVNVEFDEDMMNSLGAVDTMALVDGKAEMLGKMEEVRTAFGAGKAIFRAFGGLAQTIIGDWRNLPQTKPNFEINTTVHIGSYELPIIIPATIVPDSWWFYVQMLRNMEVIGLAIYFFWKCQQLIIDTLGAG